MGFSENLVRSVGGRSEMRGYDCQWPSQQRGCFIRPLARIPKRFDSIESQSLDRVNMNWCGPTANTTSSPVFLDDDIAIEGDRNRRPVQRAVACSADHQPAAIRQCLRIPIAALVEVVPIDHDQTVDRRPELAGYDRLGKPTANDFNSEISKPRRLERRLIGASSHGLMSGRTLVRYVDRGRVGTGETFQ